MSVVKKIYVELVGSVLKKVTDVNLQDKVVEDIATMSNTSEMIQGVKSFVSGSLRLFKRQAKRKLKRFEKKPLE